MPLSPPHLHLAVALDGAGWHPAAWREPAARPAELFTARYLTDLVAEAERGLLDFVTIEDSLCLQSSHPDRPDGRTDRIRGRLDAVLIAARVAPPTRHIGLVPTAIVTHTEPFHLSKAIATLDHVSRGRAGIRVKVSGRADEFAHVGRRAAPAMSGARTEPAAPPSTAAVERLFAEARDYVAVLSGLWDSWEDDAEIRDVATGRFIDRAKLHYIDFEGAEFSVKGPSITPRSPQGRPPVAALAHDTVPYELVATSADIGFVTPRDTDDARAIVARIRHARAEAGRADDRLHIFGDLLVYLDDDPGAAADRRARLDERAGAAHTSDAPVFTGTPAELADLLQEGQRAGLTGFRLRPAALPHDLERITRALVPELHRRGAFRTAYRADTLRGLLGLPRPASRYAAS
ncbi:LLM class flavin-dependent oxidoreductase [Streptomyces niveus]|uniref:LLM class flavin-dependent oxidoreductase n=1 Tax=Streptomyces niveus TaxID=193462 RepID=UPI003626959E